jgi:signal peptidase I
MAGQDRGTGPPPPDANVAPGGLGAPAEFATLADAATRADAADPATRRAGIKPGTRGQRRGAGFWREGFVLIVVAAVLTVLVKSFFIEAYRIPSGSMENTLRIGDRVLVNKLIYRIRGIDRGDVVVFSGTGSWGPPAPPRSGDTVVVAYRSAMQAMGLQAAGTDYVKRVIGLPGDHVACCDIQGRITVNGVPLQEESYVYPGEAPSDELFSVTVPPGRLWVMGDHRGDSADSRYHPDDPGDGTIPESAVVGRAFLVIWPPSQVKSLPIPETFTRRRAASMAAAVIPLGAGIAGMLPLALAQRRLRGRSPSSRR